MAKKERRIELCTTYRKEVGKTEPISYDVSLLYRVLIGIDRQIFNALKFPSWPIAGQIAWFRANNTKARSSELK